VTYVPIESSAGQVTISPDGKTALVSQWLAEAVSVVNLRTDAVIKEIEVGREPREVALTPDGRFGFVLAREPAAIWVIDLQKLQAINFLVLDPARPVSDLTITPDQSPTAAFAVTGISTGFTATFDGSASTDPDGTVARYSWAFGDVNGASEVSPNLGGTDLGSTVSHTYPGPGTYPASLAVVDNEGCGVAQVFTGRTAYCSGNPAAKVTHPVELKGPPAPIATCSARFAIAGVSHNRKNGTVRLRLRFPTTGSFLLFGRKLHAVTRKVRTPGTKVVMLHARVELNKQLKKTLRAQVRYRVTFTPSAGCGSKTAHRSITLLRAPRKPHHR
jgi:YVTN family beta-propeller protein